MINFWLWCMLLLLSGAPGCRRETDRALTIRAVSQIVPKGDQLKLTRGRGRDGGTTILTESNIVLNDGFRIENGWRYHAGDDSTWSSVAYNDSAWEIVNSRINLGDEPVSGWNGSGWFRLHLDIDSTLWNKPLAFNLRQAGASEIYLDGKLLYRFGVVGRSKKDEQKWFGDRNPNVLTFSSPPRHLLALRYSNFEPARFSRLGFYPGFQLTLIDMKSAFAQARRFETSQMIFATILAALAFLHLVLFLFYPRFQENLFYALSTIGVGGVWFANCEGFQAIARERFLFFSGISNVSQVVAIAFGLLLANSLLGKRFPKRTIVYLISGAAIMIWGMIEPGRYYYISKDVFTTIVVLEMLWKAVRAPKEDPLAAWILTIAFVALAAGILYEILLGNRLITPIPGQRDVYIYGVLALGLAMSVFLSRRFAKTNQELENKLQQVRTLSERALVQERQAHQADIARRLLEADNLRKTKELEEARKLQLSMLPKTLPVLPLLDIAVYMKTATEVGGDYYDFLVDENGTLTVALGDATGHGINAGTMVASIKSLFAAFGSSLDLRSFFNKSSEIIKGMHLGNLYMAMMLVKISGRNLTVSSAGMPPMLIYRDDIGAVEEILLKGMPLGGPYSFDYQQQETVLQPGDAILLMSDGYPELFNEENEMLDYPRIVEIFEAAASKPAAEVIDHLWKAGEAWSNGTTLSDDTTLLVIKIKETGDTK